MKLNRLWLLPLVTTMVGGCVSNYHGPEYQGTPNHLPPAFWDTPFEGAEAKAAPGSAVHGGQTAIASCTALCEPSGAGQENEALSLAENANPTR